MSVERLEAEVAVQDYVAGFRDVARFEQCCQQCPNYGHRHGCPPFDYDTTASIMRYSRVRLLGAKVTPQGELDGMACGFVGKCPYCSEPCARIDGKPCRHPDKVRPSLEALGFDVSKTASQLLGVEMQWGRDGMMPDYLVLVCAVFY